MNGSPLALDTLLAWESPVAFRLFGDHPDPTLSVPEQIAAKVGDRIIGGLLAPGLRIGEQELADEFKVSRAPVREAIRILEREGLATIQPRRGAIVTRLSAKELRELFEIRAGLFDVVLRKVCAAPSPELLSILHDGVARLERLSRTDDGGDAYAETVYRLTLIIARFAGNERLQRMVNALALQTLRYTRLSLQAADRRERSVRLWQRSLAALASGNGDEVLRLSHQRILESADEASRLLAD